MTEIQYQPFDYAQDKQADALHKRAREPTPQVFWKTNKKGEPAEGLPYEKTLGLV